MIGAVCTRSLVLGAELVRAGAPRVFVREFRGCATCLFPDPVGAHGVAAVHWREADFPWSVADQVAEDAIADMEKAHG